MKKSMDAKRIGALAVLPLFVVAAPLAASAEETLTKPAQESAAPSAVETPAVTEPAAQPQPAATVAPEPSAADTAEKSNSPDSNAAVTAKEDSVPTAVAAQDLIGKPVMGSDGKSVGKVAAIKADKTGQLIAVHIETGGMFGFWTTLREVPAGDFTSTGEGIKLGLASSDIESLRKVEAPKG